MLRVALKGLLARKWRMMLTSVAIIVGVAFIVGTSLLGASLDNSIRGQIADTVGQVDVVVRAKLPPSTGENNARGVSLRPQIPAAALGAVKDTPGVVDAQPVVSSEVNLYGPDGQRIGGGFGPPTILGNWIDDQRLGSFKVTDGAPPDGDDEVVVDRATAADSNLKIGDRIRLTSSGNEATFTISGIAGVGPDGDKDPGTPVVMTSLPAAQKLTSHDDTYDAVYLLAADGVTQTELRSRVEPSLPDGTEAISGADYVAEVQQELSEVLGFLTDAISAFGWVAEFAACFVIYNTFNIIVTQRLRELALFRAIGASRRQVLGSVLLEALGVGVIAGVVGLLGGWLLALGLVKGLSSLLDVPSDLPGLTVGVAVLALAIGVIVTAVSALIPALRATRIPPVAAMGEASIDRSGSSLVRGIIGGLMLVVGVIAVTIGNTSDSIDNPLPLVALGAGLIFISIVVGGPVVVRPLVTVIGAPLAALGVGGRLARDNAKRNPKRTIATATVLTIGIALIVIVSLIASSLKSSIDSTIRTTFAGVDAIVGDPIDGSLPPDAQRLIAETPQVAASTPVRYGAATLLNSKAALDNAARGSNKGELDFIAGVDRDSYLAFLDLGNLTPPIKTLGDNEAITDVDTAKTNNWKVGDEIRVANPTAFGATEPITWTLVATYDRAVGPSLTVNTATFDAATPAQFHVDASIYVKARPGVDSAELTAALKTAMKNSPDTSVGNIAKFIERRTQVFDVILGIIYVLMFLTIIVAAIGVVNTIGLSLIERRREIGMLRAVGMPQGQLGRTVTAEAAIVALLGTLIGVIVGVALGVSFVNGFDIETITPVIPWATIVVICVLGVIGGVLSGLWPAWRASRTNVLEAIATA